MRALGSCDLLSRRVHSEARKKRVVHPAHAALPSGGFNAWPILRVDAATAPIQGAPALDALVRLVGFLRKIRNIAPLGNQF